MTERCLRCTGDAKPPHRCEDTPAALLLKVIDELRDAGVSRLFADAEPDKPWVTPPDKILTEARLLQIYGTICLREHSVMPHERRDIRDAIAELIRRRRGINA